MPIIKSAKKRVRVAKRAHIENAKTKRTLRESVKAFRIKLTAKKDTTQAQKDAYSAIDTAVKKGVMSKNKAARKKSQLNTAAKQAGTTKPGTKTAKKSTPVKKASAAKKPAAKKAVTKKPSAKKTTKK